jgi:hypothetical protein
MLPVSVRGAAHVARAGAFAALLFAGLARAADTKPPDVREMRASIFDKLAYDRSYFQRIVTLREQGKSDKRLTAEEFESEVRRARANLPVLERRDDLGVRAGPVLRERLRRLQLQRPGGGHPVGGGQLVRHRLRSGPGHTLTGSGPESRPTA